MGCTGGETVLQAVSFKLSPVVSCVAVSAALAAHTTMVTVHGVPLLGFEPHAVPLCTMIGGHLLCFACGADTSYEHCAMMPSWHALSIGRLLATDHNTALHDACKRTRNFICTGRACGGQMKSPCIATLSTRGVWHVAWTDLTAVSFTSVQALL